jgi:hypothetical protein
LPFTVTTQINILPERLNASNQETLPEKAANMVYVNIPYVVENDRIEASLAQRELEALNISEAAKHDAFAAIYNKRPRGVNFDRPNEAILLQNALYRLGVPHRLSSESEYKYELLP